MIDEEYRMDKFEEMMQKMQRMSDAERNKAMADARSMCTCPACPTYTDCMRGKHESLFCAIGKTGCVLPEKRPASVRHALSHL